MKLLLMNLRIKICNVSLLIIRVSYKEKLEISKKIKNLTAIEMTNVYYTYVYIVN